MKFNKDMIYNSKTNKWYKNGNGCGYKLMGKCKGCGEQYFMRYDKPTEYCSYSCCNKGVNNPMYGKTHTNEVKESLRESIKKSQQTIKEMYSVDNISQIDDVKKKKGQTVLSLEYIDDYVKQFNYELIEKDSVNNKNTMLKLKCPKGHIFNMRYKSFKRGNRCQECYYESLRNQYGIYDLEDYYTYKKAVYNLSNRIYRKYRGIINPNNYKRSKREYQLDHKFSILEGYKNNVPIDIISSLPNLEMITAFDNLSKQDRCSMSLDELYDSYNNWVNNCI